MPTGGALVVDGLRRAQTRFVFGIPAVHNLPIYDALSTAPSIRNVAVKHEQSAGFMAIGAAYATGTPAACLVGCGPGATNVLTPVGEAYLNSTPMLVVAGGLRTTSAGKGALHDIDQISMFTPVTKMSARLTDSTSLDYAVEGAVRTSLAGRPRPVFIEVPFDILSSQVPARQRGGDVPETGRPKFPLESMASVSRAISNAKRPLIIAGGGINSAEAWEQLRKLAEGQQIPVAMTISAKGAFPEDHPLSAGQLWDGVARRAAEDADVVLAIGCRFSERSTASWGLRFSGSLIQVDIDPAEIGRNYPVAMGVNSHAKDFLDALLQEMQEVWNPERRSWVERVAHARGERVKEIERQDLSRPGDRTAPQSVVRELSSALLEDTLVVAETGHAFWWTALMLQVKRPRSFLAPAGNSTLGFGFPAALGAKCARPERPVVSLVGDGGFIFTCQEIATSVEEKLPVATVVFDDGGYAAIREYQRKGYGSRFVGVDFSVRPDFVKLAQSLGADGMVVESSDGVAPALKEACRSSRTLVVDIKINREEDVLPKFFTEIYRQR